MPAPPAPHRETPVRGCLTFPLFFPSYTRSLYIVIACDFGSCFDSSSTLRLVRVMDYSLYIRVALRREPFCLLFCPLLARRARGSFILGFRKGTIRKWLLFCLYSFTIFNKLKFSLNAKYLYSCLFIQLYNIPVYLAHLSSADVSLERCLLILSLPFNSGSKLDKTSPQASIYGCNWIGLHRLHPNEIHSRPRNTSKPIFIHSLGSGTRLVLSVTYYYSVGRPTQVLLVLNWAMFLLITNLVTSVWMK